VSDTELGYTRGRRSTVSAPVYKILAKNVGLPQSIDDLVAQTGLKREQVQAAMYNLRHRGGYDIDAVVQGQVYRLRSLDRKQNTAVPAPGRPSKRIFEEIGVMRNGTVVVQDEDSRLYKLEEL
jgi:biotin operon repressor